MFHIFAQAQGSDLMIFNITNLSNIPNPLASIEKDVMVVAYVLTVVGFFLTIWQHKDSPTPEMMSLLKCAIIIAVIAMLPWLKGIVKDIFYYFPEKLLKSGAGINGTGDRLREMLMPGIGNYKLSIFDMGVAAIAMTILEGIMGIVGFIGSFALIPAYYIQHFLEVAGFTFMPIALSCMTIPALKEKGTNFVLTMLSILAWPLGFVLVNIAAASVLDSNINMPLSGGWSVISGFLVPCVSATILIAGTSMVPLFCYFIFTTGGGYIPPGAAGQVLQQANMVGKLAKAIPSGSK